LASGYWRTARLSDHSDAVRAVAISPDGQTLASASGDKTIKIWRLSAWGTTPHSFWHSQGVWSVAISPDGQTVVSGSMMARSNCGDWALGTVLFLGIHKEFGLSPSAPMGTLLVAVKTRH